ncbi:MAG: tryptophan synthase subunit beta [Clostridiales bacterium]|jgi:tryptophan synthase beta subunit|nr:tryptophan synthase subunit beta [Clostridiales bacterium]
MKKKYEVDFNTYLKEYPNSEGYFGEYGGAYLPEELVPAFEEITVAYKTICHSAQFINELRRIRREFQGRPTPVYHCERLSRLLGTTQIYLKREDLNHTGAHKLNHCMGEGLLAKFMGKKKLIAETGAGQHGVALATAAAYFGLECDIYMGEVDIAKQAPNVARMRVLGANVIPVSHGLKTLKEAVDAAFEAYLKEYKDAIYCIGSVVGPHPFPLMVRDFQMVVGIEAKEQFVDMTGILPDAVIACVGGGSNAMGMFPAFLNEPVDIYGVEPMGRGPNLGDHAASITFGEKGILHGFESIMLKDDKGDAAPVYSIASGLDYPSTGPEHAFLHDIGRVQYASATDKEAVEAFFKLSRYEGIIPALESSHAVAFAMKLAREKKYGSVLVNLSGRGDKDLDYVIENYGFGEEYK